MASRIDRMRGALLGLAVGDALGTTLEFRTPGSFDPLTGMAGGGPFGLLPGQWTDDTSMALCLAESLVECNGFDPADQMRRYVRWFRDGHWSSTGRCFDIGGTIREALYRFEESGEPFSGTANEYSAGNGCIMRLAPVPMYFSHDESETVRLAGESSKTTHGAAACIDASRFLGCLLIAALNGEPKEEILHPARWNHGALSASVEAIRQGSYRDKAPPAICGTGYVVDCLEAALWAFSHATSFEEGALAAVNLGNDADTTGAVYGQIAGAYYGEQGIPAEWLSRLWRRGEIGAMAERLAG